MTQVTTHVLDTSSGMPVQGLVIRFERVDPAGPRPLARSTTGPDGRVPPWPDAAAGRYRLVFEVARWFAEAGRDTLYTEITVEVELNGDGHCHLPLLLAPFGYSTYRGS